MLQARPAERLLRVVELDTEALPAALDAVEEIHRAMGELQMITQSDLERERYEARLKMQRDISTGLYAAREEGELIGQIHLCEDLLQRAQTPAAQLLALSLADLERLAQQLKAELTGSLSPPP